MTHTFGHFTEHSTTLSLDKTKLGLSHVQLGEKVDGSGYRVGTAVPTIVPEVRSAPGLLSWLSPSVPSFAALAAPTHGMTKTGLSFNKSKWGRTVGTTL